MRSARWGHGVQDEHWRALDKVGFERRVIAQALIAPSVVIETADRLQLG